MKIKTLLGIAEKAVGIENELGLRRACKYGHLDVVQFLVGIGVKN